MRELAQEVFLSGRELDEIAVAAQLATAHVEIEIAKAHIGGGRRSNHNGSSQQVLDAQQKLARLKRFHQIVIAARGKSGNPVIRIGKGR